MIILLFNNKQKYQLKIIFILIYFSLVIIIMLLLMIYILNSFIMYGLYGLMSLMSSFYLYFYSFYGSYYIMVFFMDIVVSLFFIRGFDVICVFLLWLCWEFFCEQDFYEGWVLLYILDDDFFGVSDMYEDDFFSNGSVFFIQLLFIQYFIEIEFFEM